MAKTYTKTRVKATEGMLLISKADRILAKDRLPGAYDHHHSGTISIYAPPLTFCPWETAAQFHLAGQGRCRNRRISQLWQGPPDVPQQLNP